MKRPGARARRPGQKEKSQMSAVSLHPSLDRVQHVAPPTRAGLEAEIAFINDGMLPNLEIQIYGLKGELEVLREAAGDLIEQRETLEDKLRDLKDELEILMEAADDLIEQRETLENKLGDLDN